MYEWIKIWYIRQLFWEYDHITVLNERNLFPWHHTELKTFTDKNAHGMWLHDLAWLQSWIKYWTVITLLARQNDFQQIITVLDLIISAVQRSDWSNNCAWAEPIYLYARFKFCPWSRSDFLRIVLHLAFLSRRWLCEIQTGLKNKKKHLFQLGSECVELGLCIVKHTYQKGADLLIPSGSKWSDYKYCLDI